MDPKINEYIRANHNQYTPAAIRVQLIAAGYDPAVVDAALAAFASERATKSAGRAPVRTYVWSIFWIGAAGILLGIAVLLSVSYNPTVAVRVGIFGVGWLAGYLVLGYFLARWISRRAVTSRGMGWVGTVLLAPIAFILIGYGSCAATTFLWGSGPGG